MLLTPQALNISVSSVKVRLHRAHDVAKVFGASVEDGNPNIEKEVASVVINCKHVWNHISEYLDETLSEEILRGLQKHLDHCEICSAILDSTRNIIILSADGFIFELPVGFSERLHARIDHEFLQFGDKPRG